MHPSPHDRLCVGHAIVGAVKYGHPCGRFGPVVLVVLFGFVFVILPEP
jgi:hypothetical protein